MYIYECVCVLLSSGMAVASKAFCDVLLELYEPGWAKESDFKESVNVSMGIKY